MKFECVWCGKTVDTERPAKAKCGHAVKWEEMEKLAKGLPKNGQVSFGQTEFVPANAGVKSDRS